MSGVDPGVQWRGGAQAEKGGHMLWHTYFLALELTEFHGGRAPRSTYECVDTVNWITNNLANLCIYAYKYVVIGDADGGTVLW
jgi:hypothetical protein